MLPQLAAEQDEVVLASRVPCIHLPLPQAVRSDDAELEQRGEDKADGDDDSRCEEADFLLQRLQVIAR